MTDTHTFNIEHIFLNDSSFKSEQPIHRSTVEWNPQANMSLDVKTSKFDDQHDVSVIISVKVTIENKDVFNVTVNQGGTFTIKGYSEAEVKHLTESFCASILYPYARQKISDMITQAGYPPLHLSPVDFESRFRQMNAAAESATEASTDKS